MQSTKPHVDSVKCHLLNLPAELRNHIYEDVSEGTPQTFVIDLVRS